jgi:hypothetical protein
MDDLELMYVCRLCGEMFGSGAKTGDTPENQAVLWINMEAKLLGKVPPLKMVGDTFAQPFQSHQCGRMSVRDVSFNGIGLADFAGLRRIPEVK